jgi:hypothetical protein
VAVAVTVAVPSARPFTLNVADVWDAGIVTVAGISTFPVPPVRVTTNPPAGAGLETFTVHCTVTLTGTISGDGEKVMRGELMTVTGT